MTGHQNRLPHQIDPFRLSETGAELSGEIPLRQMKRLIPLMENDEGTISVDLKFDMDDMGVHCVSGQIRTSLSLTCQRCLEAFEFSVDQPIKLAWVRNDHESQRVIARYEPYLVESTPLTLNDVIEDELILALPQIPMHALEECSYAETVQKQESITSAEARHESGAENSDEAESSNPFSVLKKLKDD